MPIRESSFRIGAGRYLQEEGILARAGEEISRFGNSVLVIGDTKSLSITRGLLEKSLCAAGMEYRFITQDGSCNEADAKAVVEGRTERKYDLIAGVGGGVIMDFAKLCAHRVGCPVVNIPTSSATCAAFTPLSVCYTPQGETVGTQHFEREVDAVLVDTAVMAAQPVRLLLAGVFDAMAKFIEIKHRFNPSMSCEEYPMGLDYAYVLSQHTYKSLLSNIDRAVEDCKQKKCSQALEQVVFTSIAVTGVISGIARGSNQCALAHKFYENARRLYPAETKPYLHGEIVGVGLLLQNHFNREIEQNLPLSELMRKNQMPHSVSGVGLPTDGDTVMKFFERLKNSSSVRSESDEECARLLESLNYFWRI